MDNIGSFALLLFAALQKITKKLRRKNIRYFNVYFKHFLQQKVLNSAFYRELSFCIEFIHASHSEQKYSRTLYYLKYVLYIISTHSLKCNKMF